MALETTPLFGFRLFVFPFAAAFVSSGKNPANYLFILSSCIILEVNELALSAHNHPLSHSFINSLLLVNSFMSEYLVL